MKADVGSLMFIADTNGKKRPNVCISVFKNSAGVPYDWLILPITSKTCVGKQNLIEIAHPQLSKRSYAKLNNIHCISWSDDIEVSKEKIEEKYLVQIAERLREVIFRTKNETE